MLNPGSRLIEVNLLGIVLLLGLPAGSAGENTSLRVPEGFEAELFAGDDLAHNIYSMTLDAEGRVVVSGPGYVRTLIDSDNDGRADETHQYADGPETGAQGLDFDGDDLLCTGDRGLIRYTDADGDNRADGPPEVLFSIRAGGEHHAHAVRKGPDGWWYLLAGNQAGVSQEDITLEGSPVSEPQAGCLVRFRPDFTGREVFAHGFRNAYDFAFHPAGDVFAYDSDGERDVSLPWYRPTRVFQVLPGGHAGWISRSWKRPSYFAEMPPVVAAFGRGSPTGVVCYRHRRFPEKYRGAVFVLDWTFGRVLALPLQKTRSRWTSRPETFITGRGQFGFAPTDIAVGPEGSLFVSVGGRGTRGGVYRVSYRGDSQPSGNPLANLKGIPAREAKLRRCLAAPQPLSRWSRANWVPLAKQLGSRSFVQAALNAARPAAQRMRAMEILTELFDGVDAATLEQLADADSPQVRARAVWSYGHTRRSALEAAALRPFLEDDDALVVRAALQALLSGGSEAVFRPLLPALARTLGSPSRFVRSTAARLVSRMGESTRQQLRQEVEDENIGAAVSFELGRLMHRPRLAPDTLETVAGLLEEAIRADAGSKQLALQAVRVMQLALGDVGPSEDEPPVFDGYTAQGDLSGRQTELESIPNRLESLYPTGLDRVDRELARLLAILRLENGSLLDHVLAKITRTSDPVDDIHHLIVAACLPAERTPSRRETIARALVDLEEKIRKRNLNRDRHWDRRIGEMYARLVQFDPELPAAVIGQPSFGQPGHVVFVEEMSAEERQKAIDAFVQRIQQTPDYRWSGEVVHLVGRSNDPENRSLIRPLFEEFALRGAVLKVLAESPQDRDRGKFLAGLDSSRLDVLAACLNALQALPTSRKPHEQFALLRTVRRLEGGQQEYRLREQAVKILQRNLGRDFGFEFGQDGHRPQRQVVKKWTAWLTKEYPQEAARQNRADETNATRILEKLAEVDWDSGDPARGRELFRARSCSRCHQGRRAVGPDLDGVARRFSRKDLFTAIARPNRDVPPRYQTTLVQTKTGKLYSGVVIYQSVDGLTLLGGAEETYRIEAAEIEQRKKQNRSLMPAGLLKDLSCRDLADLYAYLKTLDRSARSE